MFVALPVADLHDAEPVARGDEAHGFGIDGDRARRRARLRAGLLRGNVRPWADALGGLGKEGKRRVERARQAGYARVHGRYAFPKAGAPALDPVLALPESAPAGRLAARAGRGAARRSIRRAGSGCAALELTPLDRRQGRDPRAGSLSRAGAGARAVRFRCPTACASPPSLVNIYKELRKRSRRRRRRPAATSKAGRGRACCCSTIR